MNRWPLNFYYEYYAFYNEWVYFIQYFLYQFSVLYAWIFYIRLINSVFISFRWLKLLYYYSSQVLKKERYQRVVIFPIDSKIIFRRRPPLYFDLFLFILYLRFDSPWIRRNSLAGNSVGDLCCFSNELSTEFAACFNIRKIYY